MQRCKQSEPKVGTCKEDIQKWALLSRGIHWRVVSRANPKVAPLKQGDSLTTFKQRQIHWALLSRGNAEITDVVGASKEIKAKGCPYAGEHLPSAEITITDTDPMDSVEKVCPYAEEPVVIIDPREFKAKVCHYAGEPVIF